MISHDAKISDRPTAISGDKASVDAVQVSCKDRSPSMVIVTGCARTGPERRTASVQGLVVMSLDR